MSPFTVPQGQFDLARHPIRKNDTLRAWDAADEYLLGAIAGAAPTAFRDADPLGAGRSLGGDALDLQGTVLIVNDGAGALATALATAEPLLLTDSYVAQLATAANLDRNHLDRALVTPIGGLAPLPPRIDVVIVKVPKSLALLEDQLVRIAPNLHAESIVLAGGMAKHIHSSTIELFEQIIGPTRTSLAQRKARLISSTPDAAVAGRTSPWPKTFTAGNAGLVITNHAGVFSAERLDVGTRFLLDTMPPHVEGVDGEPPQIIDLGCGNGIVGLAAAIRFADAEVTFVDESYAAVASAEATFRANLDDDRVGHFVVGDGLDHLASADPIEPGSIDLVLNNPPFHDDHAIGDATAWQMFTGAHRALRVGGELRVVGNRHLAYHAKLKRIFGRCDVIDSNAKFVVFRANR